MKTMDRTYPVSAWVLLVAMLSMGADCNKKEDPTPPGGGGSGTPANCTTGSLAFSSTARLQMCLDGTLVTLEADGSNVFNSGSQTGYDGGMHYASRFYAMAINDFRFGLEVGLFAENGGNPTDEQFVDFFTPGPWEHGDPTSTLGKASFFWREAGGEPAWRTHCGSGEQSAFNFTITDSEAFEEDGEQHVRVRVEFAGTVYNCGGAGSKQISHGTVITEFRRGD